MDTTLNISQLPVLTATNIEFEVDLNEDLMPAAIKMRIENPDRLAGILGLVRWRLDMLTEDDLTVEVAAAIRHRTADVDDFLPSLPTSIVLPSNYVWDEDAITEYISNSSGWLFNSYSLECSQTVAEMESHLKELDDISSGSDEERQLLRQIYAADIALMRCESERKNR